MKHMARASNVYSKRLRETHKAASSNFIWGRMFQSHLKDVVFLKKAGGSLRWLHF